MDSIGGSVWPFSQFNIVQGLTPSRSAVCFWVSSSSSRRFLMCSPKVCGSKSVSFGFKALSLIGPNCKRATRPCTFDPVVLQCTTGETAACLTSEQLRAARNVYRGIPAPGGSQRWNGPVVGSEADWIPAFADNGGYGVFIGHFVYGQRTPPFAPRGLDVAAEYDRIRSSVTPFMAAPSPDLSRFKARGGKIIQYHGWHDAVVAPHTSPNYTHALAIFEQLKGSSRSEERRVGKECRCTCRSRWSPYH